MGNKGLLHATLEFLSHRGKDSCELKEREEEKYCAGINKNKFLMKYYVLTRYLWE